MQGKKMITRLLSSLLCAVVVSGCSFLVCNSFFPKISWSSGTPWPEDLEHTCLAVENIPLNSGRMDLELPASPVPMSIVVAQANPFVLELESGREIYRYSSSGQPYQRLHVIDLPAADAVTQLTFRPLQGRSLRILLGTAETIHNMISLADQINYVSIGMQLLVLVYAFSLYMSKRSEHYLLALTALTAGNLVFTLCSSMKSVPFLTEGLFRAIQTPLVLFLRLLIVCCCILIQSFPQLRTPKKNLLLFMAGAYGGMILCHLAGWSNITRILIDGLPLIGMAILIWGVVRGEPNTMLPLVGLSILIGINRVYQIYATQGARLHSALPAFLYLWQFGCIFFIFFFMLATNRLFGQKFSEAERLTLALQESNQQLDQRVQERTREIEEANRRIKDEQKQRSQTMLNLLHDLRTPIFGALGCAEMLQSQWDEETMAILEQKLRDLSHLAEDLFLVAKLKESKITFVLSEEHLLPILQDIAHHAAVQAAQQQITVQTRFRADPIVTADPFRLRQAISNLVDNAFRYTPDGKALILQLDEQEGEAAISVTDTGKGIDEKELPHIFEQYYHSGSRHSTGLGLTIAHEIITAMNGRIEVKSQRGEGSTFTVYLPLASTL